MATPVHKPWLLYGAYGFTGRLIAEAALRRGHRPVLAGRDLARLNETAHALGLMAMPVSLDAADLRGALRSVRLVLNASGPLSDTGLPLIEACLDTRTSYADISSEFDHLRAVAALGEQAQRVGIALLPGAGFGVTLGDCLAHHVIDRLPDATHLRLSVAANNAQTTLAVRRTIVNVLARGGYAVEGGKWRSRSLAHKSWTLTYGGKRQTFAAAPMGELAAAFQSTRVPNIVVGRPISAGAAGPLRTLSPLIRTALSLAPLRGALGGGSNTPARKPEPAGGYNSWLIAEAQDARGAKAVALLECGEGYTVTAEAAVLNVEALLAGSLVGASTPAGAFGAAHVVKIPAVRLTDLDRTWDGNMVAFRRAIIKVSRRRQRSDFCPRLQRQAQVA